MALVQKLDSKSPPLLPSSQAHHYFSTNLPIRLKIPNVSIMQHFKHASIHKNQKIEEGCKFSTHLLENPIMTHTPSK